MYGQRRSAAEDRAADKDKDDKNSCAAGQGQPARRILCPLGRSHHFESGCSHLLRQTRRYFHMLRSAQPASFPLLGKKYDITKQTR